VIKDITTKDKGVLDEVLGKQRSNHGKEGLGYVTKSKKRKNKKNKTKNVKSKTSTTEKNVTKDKTNNKKGVSSSKLAIHSQERGLRDCKSLRISAQYC